MAPKQGDLIMLDVPCYERDQQARQALVVLSNTSYNRLTGFVSGMLVTTAELTDKILYLPIVDKKSGLTGAINTWQLFTYDYAASHGKVISSVGAVTLNSLKQKVLQIYNT
ncbi:type II toxin-antitoxin system PemK/MazF family toxin [Loigolactobacillus binensis]|uniref:Type II toxin-antitoxin system PemK/MazF family toxin n=1 Tax=Loigolactobacillus binensis TaxID=2559922 RepID=A0ABW3EFM8_9LACO|nr:type II toxin-antitoxin system PemK/MazF family toxin [Loigolactobacillus binensis]